jgi:DNA invertase Pin-like site-specific DNA recombinase
MATHRLLLERPPATNAARSGLSSARREGHLIGYARVSTTGQDTATQEAELKAAGCTLIRTETASGGSRNGRNELASILDFIRPDDVLIVVKLDRLGRNTRDVLNLVHELEEKGASLRVLEPAIDTGGPMGRMVLTVLGMVAEMELGFIRDRQRAGIDAAKAKGIYKGHCHFPPRTHCRAAQGRDGRHGDRQCRRVQAGERLQGAQVRRAQLGPKTCLSCSGGIAPLVLKHSREQS